MATKPIYTVRVSASATMSNSVSATGRTEKEAAFRAKKAFEKTNKGFISLYYSSSKTTIREIKETVRVSAPQAWNW